MTFWIMIWLSGLVIGYAMHDYWRWSAIRAASRLAGEELGPVICEECGIYPADNPRGLCPGCDAYRDHTGAV